MITVLSLLHPAIALNPQRGKAPIFFFLCRMKSAVHLHCSFGELIIQLVIQERMAQNAANAQHFEWLFMLQEFRHGRNRICDVKGF